MRIADFLITGIIIYMGLSPSLDAQDRVYHDFDDGNFYPYKVPKADQESRVTIVNKRVQTKWEQDLYNGTNSGRKAQIKQAAAPHTEELLFTQHIWMGFLLKIHSDYMKDNTNTNAGLMQIWGHNGVSGAENHMCMLKFDGRNGGALVWQHRYNSVANKTHHLVYPNFPRDTDVSVVMHVQLAEKNKGIVQVWVDGELKLDKSNQTIGWGEQDASGMINGTYCHGTSIGQYNYFENAGYDDAYDGDDHYFDGHMNGETRTVTYDKVALYNGSNGYDLVDPSGGTGNLPSVSIPTPAISAQFRLIGKNQLVITPANPLNANIEISLFSPSGKMLNTHSTNSVAPVRFKVISAGLYVVKLQSPKGQLIKKIVVQ